MLDLMTSKGTKVSGAPKVSWQDKLRIVNDLMKEVSRQTDAQELVRIYSRGVRQMMPVDGMVSMSRRGLEAPRYKITRFSGWTEEVNPWEQPERLPVLEGGVLGKWLYAATPEVITRLEVDPSDPGYEYLRDVEALIVMPQYENGEALNCTVLMWNNADELPHADFPNILWQSNLFGRTTANLVLGKELGKAYNALERELRAVGEIQRSLLPSVLPAIPGLLLAARYETSQQAGGDYYDIFKLPGGRYGFLMADVSGHGTPAAVIMAVTHAIARTYAGVPDHPCQFLDHLNTKLVDYYTTSNGTFVTAFYGVYDPESREFRYACAGHNPPRLVRKNGSVEALDAVGGLPLGIMATQECAEAWVTLSPGDTLALYTDGIVEAQDKDNELFGTKRLDGCLSHSASAGPEGAVKCVFKHVDQFTNGAQASDDRTLLIARAE